MDALVIIDMQYYFISDSLRESAPGIALPVPIIPAIAGCLNEATDASIEYLRYLIQAEVSYSGDWLSRFHT